MDLSFVRGNREVYIWHLDLQYWSQIYTYLLINFSEECLQSRVVVLDEYLVTKHSNSLIGDIL